MVTVPKDCIFQKWLHLLSCDPVIPDLVDVNNNTLTPSF